MQPTSRKHRRVRPGAVPVHVLLASRPPAPTHTVHARRGGTWSNVGKIVGMGVAAAVLCGSMVTANTISQRRQSAATAPSADVSGVHSLSLAAPAPPSRATADDHPHLGAAAPADRTPDATADASAPTSAQRETQQPARPSPATPRTSTSQRPSTQRGNADTSTSTAQRPMVEHRAAQLRIVRDFYGSLPTADRGVLAALAPGLLGSSTDDLLGGGQLHSLDSVRSVTVEELHAAGRSQVRSTVLVRSADGALVRLRQLVTLTSGAHPVIEQIELLSAQSR